jgi:beta-lactam-binding protein with PASTA domain
VTDAMKNVKAAQLIPRIRLRSTTEVAPGYVVEQTPASGEVKKDSEVELVVATREERSSMENASAAELEKFFRQQNTTTVPEVRKMYVTDAIKRLQAANFVVDLNTKVVTWVNEGTVLDVQPGVGTEAKWDSTVTLTVASADNTPVQLTDADRVQLSSQTADQLRMLLRDPAIPPTHPPHAEPPSNLDDLKVQPTMTISPDVVKNLGVFILKTDTEKHD